MHGDKYSNPIIRVARINRFNGDSRTATIIDISSGAIRSDAIIATTAMSADGVGNMFVPEPGALCLYYDHEQVGTIIIGFIPPVASNNKITVQPDEKLSKAPPNSSMHITRTGAHSILMDGGESSFGSGQHCKTSYSFLGKLVEVARSIYRRWLGGYEKMEISPRGRITWEKAVFSKQVNPSDDAGNIMNNQLQEGLFLRYSSGDGFTIECTGDAPIILKSSGIEVGRITNGVFNVTGTLSIT